MAVDITGITTGTLSDKKTGDSFASAEKVGSNSSNTESAQTSPASTITNSSVDTVTLTQQAKELRMIEKAVNEESGVDSERVESLKLEIDTGRYDINTQRVAEKLIEFESLFVA